MAPPDGGRGFYIIAGVVLSDSGRRTRQVVWCAKVRGVGGGVRLMRAPVFLLVPVCHVRPRERVSDLHSCEKITIVVI